MGRLDGKVAIVTGGAKGMGAAAVRLFTAEGARVLAVDNDLNALERLAHLIDHTHLATFAASVADADAVEAYTREAVERFGGLDAVVLNAGITGPNIPIEDYPLDAFDTVLAVDLRGVWLGLRAAIPHMKRRGGGSAVLTSSIQGLSAMPGTSGYTTAKHALVGMMKGAALELAGPGVRVNAVAPGFTETPLLAGALDAIVAEPGQRTARETLARNIPMRRLGASEEVAKVMLFLASDESSYTTGASFAVDGGVLAAWGPTPD